MAASFASFCHRFPLNLGTKSHARALPGFPTKSGWETGLFVRKESSTPFLIVPSELQIVALWPTMFYQKISWILFR